MRYLGIDFETKDPYIGLGLGPGWVTKVNYPTLSLFFVVGVSVCWYDDSTNTVDKSIYMNLAPKHSDKENNICKLKDLIKEAKDIVVMHNAQYDLGCLRSIDIEIKDLIVYDTKILATLYDSTLFSYGLDSLLIKYLGERKAGNRLIDIIKAKNLCPSLKQTNKTFEREAKKFAYSNMDVLQEADFIAMSDYANQDTQGMMRLFKYYKNRNLDISLGQYYSNIQLICTKIREPGICVDLSQLDKGISILSPAVNFQEQTLWKLLGKEINLHANELKEVLTSKGYDLPKTDKGNDSISKDWLEEHPNDPICTGLLEYRTNYILLNQFLIKVKEMQQYTSPENYNGQGYGRVFPELNVLAARTGRFSSSNPNIQNIPKRNKLYAALCRAIFVPTNRDNDWYSLDWSNQEGRLQLHFAYKKGFKLTKHWLTKFKENPALDTHSIVAEMMGGVPRTVAKTIYLGKSFCMGDGKTCKRLGLPTEMEDRGYGLQLSAGKEGKKLIGKYNNAFPYLGELQKDCMSVIRNRGYIKSIGGRQLKRPPFYKTKKGEDKDFDYKAISLLIQGSASDQCIAALTMADKAGLDIKCMVHDEFNIEGKLVDALKMKEIMEHCIELEVPSFAEIKVGKNWGYLEDVNETK